MKNQAMKERMEAHGNDLRAIFPNATEADPVKLCRKLFRLEKQAQRASLCLCNTNTLHWSEPNQFTSQPSTDEEIEKFFEDIFTKAHSILGDGPPIFVSRNPLGYALKIHSDHVKDRDLTIHRDMGGYGIIAPDLREG